MKIAIFYNLQVSGAKRVVFEHTKWLKNLGHTVEIYTIYRDDDFFDPSQLADNTYRYTYKPRVINLPFLKRLTQDFHAFYALKLLHKKIAQDIDARDYTIALIHTDALTQAPFLLRFLKTKNIYFCLEPLRMVYEYSLRVKDLPFLNYIYEMLNRSLRKNIDRENARSATFSTAISYFGRELMIEAFDLYPQISYLGVDISIFKKLHVKKKNQILFVGQKEAINGYKYAIKALENIPKNIRPNLKIISWTKNKNERLSDKELVIAYNESFVTLSLSTFDTFGLVALESLACGTPVIAFNVGGYRETMINNQTGFLVDFDAQDISEKIMLFLQNHSLSEELGKNGMEWVQKKWTWKSQIKNLEDLLVKFSQ